MRMGVTMVLLCCGPLALGAEDTRVTGMAESKLEIAGEAAGGTISIGRIRRGRLLVVETAPGESAAQVMEKLVAAHEQEGLDSPFNSLRLASDGQVLLVGNTHAGDVFVRTTDAGIETVGVVSDVRATASKADQKVSLSWTLPNPAPDRIIVRRGITGKGVPGTATSYEDEEFDERRAGEPCRLTYMFLCAVESTSGEMVRFSDIVEAKCDNPESSMMPDDTYRITTEQEYVRNGVKGHAYAGKIYKNAGTNPVSWSLHSGTLPDGLTLGMEGIDGVISGTPTQTGTWDFVVSVTDANGTTATKAYSITVTEHPVLEQ